MTSFIDDPFLLILFFVKMFTNTNCEYRKAIVYTFKPTSCLLNVDKIDTLSSISFS